MTRIVVMGPSGSGKTAIGAALAVDLGVAFIDADDLHTPENVAKMSRGAPLTDEDRMPWLDIVGQAAAAEPGVVVACSALRRRYRDRIRGAAPGILFVELVVTRDELDDRMRVRDHFMPPALLESQLSTLEHLESDEPGFAVENRGGVIEIAAKVRASLDDQSLR